MDMPVTLSQTGGSPEGRQARHLAQNEAFRDCSLPRTPVASSLKPWLVSTQANHTQPAHGVLTELGIEPLFQPPTPLLHKHWRRKHGDAGTWASLPPNPARYLLPLPAGGPHLCPPSCGRRVSDTPDSLAAPDGGTPVTPKPGSSQECLLHVCLDVFSFLVHQTENNTHA